MLPSFCLSSEKILELVWRTKSTKFYPVPCKYYFTLAKQCLQDGQYRSLGARIISNTVFNGCWPQGSQRRGNSHNRLLSLSALLLAPCLISILHGRPASLSLQDPICQTWRSPPYRQLSLGDSRDSMYLALAHPSWDLLLSLPSKHRSSERRRPPSLPHTLFLVTFPKVSSPFQAVTQRSPLLPPKWVP